MRKQELRGESTVFSPSTLEERTHVNKQEIKKKKPQKLQYTVLSDACPKILCKIKLIEGVIK